MKNEKNNETKVERNDLIKYYSINDCASMLGVHPQTIRNYIKRRVNALPHKRIGGRILVEHGQLENWLRNQ